jgi:hypothetical protein
MIQPADLLERLQVQLEDLKFMLFDEAVLSGKVPPPADTPSPELAVRFGEALILALTEEDAESCVQSNRDGARAFISIAEAVLERIEDGALHLHPRMRQPETPFFLLVSLVIDYVKSPQ